MKKALITGITGQDGSYLAESLLKKGYEVHGIIRRVAIEDPSHRLRRINHIINQIKLHKGSIENYSSMLNIFDEVKPDECFHLAAHSFVHDSFEDNFSTFHINTHGIMHVLSALHRRAPKCKFYFAGSSEMFGEAEETPQTERTRFHPRSPYAISKVTGFDTTRNYREAYDVFACSGILFNHESVPGFTPVIIKKNNLIDILPIEQIVSTYEKNKEKYFNNIKEKKIEVWDGDKFTQITHTTAYKDKKKKVFCVESSNGIIEATGDHVIFLKNKETEMRKVKQGDLLEKTNKIQTNKEITNVTEEMAWLISAFIGDGSCSKNMEKKNYKGRFINSDKRLLKKFSTYWKKVTGGYVTYGTVQSGFSNKKTSSIELNGASWFLNFLYNECYTVGGNYTKKKKIPRIILNTNKKIKKVFLDGYNSVDGLKSGIWHSDYKYRMFKTNSPVLATGLCFLIEDCLEQGYTLSVERRGRGTYYTIYLNTDKRSKIGNKGMHLAKNKQLVKKTYETRRDGYLYDLTTKSGRFVAGVGKVKIHNSPRRGFEFVTRKITDGVAKMKKGKDNVLVMGNLETKRDWGFAGDYVEAMWLMLQQEKPGDYVIATGENHTIREFIDLASKHAGLTYEIVDLHNLSIKEADNEVEKLRSQKNRFFVVKHPIWYRPAEVNSLLGDASKAEKELGWKPKMSFQELVKLMVQEDIKRVEKQAED